MTKSMQVCFKTYTMWDYVCWMYTNIIMALPSITVDYSVSVLTDVDMFVRSPEVHSSKVFEVQFSKQWTVLQTTLKTE